MIAGLDVDMGVIWRREGTNDFLYFPGFRYCFI